MKGKSSKRFALLVEARTCIVLFLMFAANAVAARNNDITIGTPGLLTTTARADGKLAVYKNGAIQFDELDDWFCLRIEQNIRPNRPTVAYYRTASDPEAGYVNFTLADVDSHSAGRHQFVTKRCSSQFEGRDFHVDYTMSYDTLNPEIVVMSILIDASKLSSSARIKFASGFDAKFYGGCDAGGAFILPDKRRPNNYNYTNTFVRLGSDVIAKLNFFGGKSVKGGGQVMGFLTMDRAFSGISVTTYTNTRGRVFVRDNVLNDMDFHPTYNLSGSQCRKNSVYNLGVAHSFSDIRGGRTTAFKSGLLFTAEVTGSLDYSWTSSMAVDAKDTVVNIAGTVDLNIDYTNYTNGDVKDMAFDIDLDGLKIAGPCRHPMLGGSFNCIAGSGTYGIRNGFHNSWILDITVPVRAEHSGVYTIDQGSVYNAKKTLPLGSKATLTVMSEANFNLSAAYPVVGGTVPARVELPAGTSELGDTRVFLRYVGDTALFSPRPDTLVIPAGANFVEFPLNVSNVVSADAKMNVLIEGTDNRYILPGKTRDMRIVVCRAIIADDVAACSLPAGQTLIDPLANDLMLPCDRSLIKIDTADVCLRRGRITINPDNTITYIADPAATAGIDSFRYAISCPGVAAIPECNSSARVRIVVQRAVPERYIACSNAEINVGMMPVAGVSYHWFDAPAGGLPLRSASDTCTVRKSGAPTDTFHVEAEYRGERLRRYPLVVEASEYCTAAPSPSSCAVAGRILFAEDFGNSSSGYMTANGTGTHNLIYSTKIGGLCAGTRLNFSARAIGMTKNGAAANAPYPRMIFTARDLASNRLLAEYATGDILSESPPVWKLYGFGFAAVGDSVLLSIRVSAPQNTAAGSDFALDDIELRLCSPAPVLHPAADSSVCSGSNVRLEASYADNGTYSRPLVVRWEHSPAGAKGTWTARKEERFASDTLHSVLDIGGFSASDTGCYRILVGDSATIDRPNCRVEHRMKIDTVPLFVAADIRVRPLVEEIAGNAIIKLSKYIEPVNLRYVEWNNYLSLDPDILDLSSGAIDASRLTPHAIYTYGYRVNAPCNTSAGKAFVRLDSFPDHSGKTKTLVVCRSDKSSESIILENVAGASMDGLWSNKRSDPDNVIGKAMTNSSPYSAHLFNARIAYMEAKNPVYDDIYNGNPAKVLTLTLEIHGQPAARELMNLKIVIMD
ncbi:MAG: hypothetical protein LBD35_05800 [Prevotellaceae bacterium]|nr:hypothetical protein [Prevotellaceae bacterium]